MARANTGRDPIPGREVAVLHDLSLVVITGLSGAGKTAASRALEDVGFYVVDNLPPALIPTFAGLCRGSAEIDRAALVVDIRGREFFASAAQALSDLEASGVPFQVLFLEAADEVLIQRYKESRRQHPMAPHGRIADGIAEERRQLDGLRGRAHRVIDTGRLRPGELRARLQDWLQAQAARRLRVTVLSFGFKHGLPPDADLVLDVRFLPNPQYVPDLRPRTGRDRAVADYVLGWPLTARYLELTQGWLDFLLPHYEGERRAELVIAIGCTGGRHRSVVLAGVLAEHLRAPGRIVELVHRDCDRPVDPA